MVHFSEAFSAQGALLAAIGGSLIGGLSVARIKGGRGMLPSATPVPLISPSVMLGGFVIKNYLNSPALLGAAVPVPSDPTLLLTLVGAAACVGAGAKMGEGCTSGNGINGLAALSKASFVFVLTFMGVGAASAAHFLGPSRMDAAELASGFPWLVLALGAAGIFAQMLPSSSSFVWGAFPSAPADVVADVGAGLAFASALSISGMVNPSKVVGFLDFTNAVHGWDPTLAFVMGAALCVALPGYQLLGLAKGATADKGIEQWAKRPVDIRTVLGGALFGLGWGMCGMCPGPAMVTAGGLSSQSALFVAVLFGVRLLVPSAGSSGSGKKEQ